MNGYKTYYWKSERGAEIDFVIQRDGQIIPIEVKSADNVRAKSLKVYMDAYKPAYAIKLSAKNFGFEGNKKPFPSTPRFVSKINPEKIRNCTAGADTGRRRPKGLE